MEEWMINDLLECSVCLERLDVSSKVLPCQHTFCRKCLEEIVSTHKELRCPECRVLVQTSIDALPPNILLMRILEGMKNIPKPKPPDHVPESEVGASLATKGTVLPQEPPLLTSSPQNGVPAPPATTSVQSVQLSNAPRTEPVPACQVLLNYAQPCAKALYNFDSKESGDLNFKKGDIILLKKQIDANWYLGQSGGSQGYFPATYVQIITPLPSVVPQCKALYDFKMTNDDEKDCLSFSKNEIVTVIRRVDENWAEGKLGDRIGIFPISFVEMNNLAKLLMKTHINNTPAVTTANSVESGEYVALTTGAGVAQSRTHSAPSSKPSSNSVTSSSDSSPTSPGSSPHANQPQVMVRNSSSRRSHREKRHSLNANKPQNCPPHDAPVVHRHSAEIVNYPEERNTPSRSRRQANAHQESAISETGVLIPGIPSPPTPKPVKQTTSVLHPPALYIALYPYKPQKADELELRKGALYTVTDKCQDGWFRGTSVRTQLSGVFPGNYVQPVKSHPHPHLSLVPPPHLATPCTSSSASSPPRPTGAPKAPLPSLSPRSSPAGSSQPPELPPRALSPHLPLPPAPRSLSPNPLPSNTSASASIPAAVVHRLANAPVPAPARNLEGRNLGGSVVPPPNVVLEASPKNEKDKKDKDKTGGLMKRLTGKKKTHTTTPYSMDNPVFEDAQALLSASSAASPAALHVRSGSCPSQLLHSLPGDAISGDPRKNKFNSASQRHKMENDQQLIMISTSTEIEAGENVEPTSTNKPKPPTPLVRERFRCIVPYPPNSEYELELRLGDVIYVHRKRDDGWYKGTLLRTGKTGLFPSSFVESF